MFRKFLLLLFVIGFVYTSCSKEEIIECEVWVDGAWQMMEITKAPEYLDGGEEGLAMAVLQETKYPVEARENGIEGRVLLQYVISIQGTIEGIMIAEDIGAGCGDAARLAFSLATEGVTFTPAELNGVPVRVRKELPVEFSLE